MLKLSYLFENFDLARNCLELYEYEESSLDHWLSRFRISSNAVYPFRSQGELCFLRLSPQAEKSFSQVTSEIALIQWLREKGFSAMKPVAMKNGQFAAQLDTPWGNYNVSCFSGVSGKSLEDTEGNLRIVQGYGRALGQLHGLLKTYPYPESRPSHRDLLMEIGQRLDAYDAPKGVRAEYSSLCGCLDELDETPAEYGVIHYDFEPDNVYYDETSDAFSVIDFDDAIRCWYALDIVRALDGLEDVVEQTDLAEAEKYFLEGYALETGLSDTQRKSFPVMRRLVRLQEYATLLHVLGDSVDEKPEWMVHLVEKLQNVLRRLEKTMETDT